MKPFTRKLVLFVYLAFVGAWLVNYFMGLGWFHGYDRAVLALSLVVIHGIGARLKSRTEDRSQSGDVVVEALDSEGAVRSDPGTTRFIQQVIVAVA